MKKVEFEGLVGFARRNYMVPMPEAANIDELNEKILKQCLAYGSHTMAGREQSVDTLYEEEKNSLLPQPEAAYSNIQPNDGRADKYATVMVDNNRYSIPWRYVGHKLKILLHVDQVEIFAGTQKLAVHERLFGNNKWSLNPDHYLELIQQRPMSFSTAQGPSDHGGQSGRNRSTGCWQAFVALRVRPRATSPAMSKQRLNSLWKTISAPVMGYFIF